MGGASSTAIPMSEIDVESYKGIRFAQEVPNTREASRGPIYVTKPVYVDPKKLTLYQSLLEGAAIDNGLRRLYGTREVSSDGEPLGFRWLTYNDVVARSAAIAAGLTAFAGLQRQGKVGLFSKNRVEWCLVSHACDRMAYVLVPLYDTLGPDAVPYIVNHTEQELLVCAQEQFKVVLECKDACPNLRYVVQYEDVTPEQREIAAHKGIELKSLSEIEALGRSRPLPADPPTPEDIATLCYTSGTTGNPKGVILLQKNMAAIGYLTEDRFNITADDVHVSYLPPAARL
ncbi:hypothetical protein PINS_up011440 [Pythium insidiosum]|nr:hypothetical protein PINS_up011440 [Pythium insidiosum]